MLDFRQRKIEKKFKRLFDCVDDYLEDKYGDDYPLHPNRRVRGTTSNKESDGLFNVGVAFSSGYGSKYGRGYIIDIEFATLATIEQEKKESIVSDCISKIEKELPVFFPNRDLEIVKDGNVYKIIGDFSLGKV